MNRYIITYVCGDTINIPTYDIITCKRENLEFELDKNIDYWGWRTSPFFKIFEVAREIPKYEFEDFDDDMKTISGCFG